MVLTEKLDPLPLPEPGAWAVVGVAPGAELHGGHQSRVFAAVWNGRPVVAKLVDTRLVDESFVRRVELTAVLAASGTEVVGPLVVHDRFVNDLAGWRLTLFPFVSGDVPDLGTEAQVRQLALGLANLHAAMRKVEDLDLPPIAPLRETVGVGLDGPFSPPQLVHGDYSPKNVLATPQGLRIFDFGEAGYGPIELEVANTLYMELFDAVAVDGSRAAIRRYEQFRRWFVDEYRRASGHSLHDELVDTAISHRVEALSQWLDNPDIAPIGVRTATSAWRSVLQTFVQTYRQA
jgi:Ser/Thr protein kinase RdoA (MazF antagonist)